MPAGAVFSVLELTRPAPFRAASSTVRPVVWAITAQCHLLFALRCKSLILLD